MKIIIERYDPVQDNMFISYFEVPVPENENWTVMNVLDYISLNNDPQLAYYKHSACDHGICGRCSVAVNGKAKLACLEVVNGYGDSVTLSPVSSGEKIRDLITRRTK